MSIDVIVENPYLYDEIDDNYVTPGEKLLLKSIKYIYENKTIISALKEDDKLLGKVFESFKNQYRNLRARATHPIGSKYKTFKDILSNKEIFKKNLDNLLDIYKKYVINITKKYYEPTEITILTITDDKITYTKYLELFRKKFTIRPLDISDGPIIIKTIDDIHNNLLINRETDYIKLQISVAPIFVRGLIELSYIKLYLNSSNDEIDDDNELIEFDIDTYFKNGNMVYINVPNATIKTSDKGSYTDLVEYHYYSNENTIKGYFEYLISIGQAEYEIINGRIVYNVNLKSLATLIYGFRVEQIIGKCKIIAKIFEKYKESAAKSESKESLLYSLEENPAELINNDISAGDKLINILQHQHVIKQNQEHLAAIAIVGHNKNISSIQKWGNYRKSYNNLKNPEMEVHKKFKEVIKEYFINNYYNEIFYPEMKFIKKSAFHYYIEPELMMHYYSNKISEESDDKDRSADYAVRSYFSLPNNILKSYDKNGNIFTDSLSITFGADGRAANQFIKEKRMILLANIIQYINRDKNEDDYLINLYTSCGDKHIELDDEYKEEFEEKINKIRYFEPSAIGELFNGWYITTTIPNNKVLEDIDKIYLGKFLRSPAPLSRRSLVRLIKSLPIKPVDADKYVMVSLDEDEEFANYYIMYRRDTSKYKPAGNLIEAIKNNEISTVDIYNGDELALYLATIQTMVGEIEINKMKINDRSLYDSDKANKSFKIEKKSELIIEFLYQIEDQTKIMKKVIFKNQRTDQDISCKLSDIAARKSNSFYKFIYKNIFKAIVKKGRFNLAKDCLLSIQKDINDVIASKDENMIIKILNLTSYKTFGQRWENAIKHIQNGKLIVTENIFKEPAQNVNEERLKSELQNGVKLIDQDGEYELKFVKNTNKYPYVPLLDTALKYNWKLYGNYVSFLMWSPYRMRLSDISSVLDLIYNNSQNLVNTLKEWQKLIDDGHKRKLKIAIQDYVRKRVGIGKWLVDEFKINQKLNQSKNKQARMGMKEIAADEAMVDTFVIPRERDLKDKIRNLFGKEYGEFVDAFIRQIDSIKEELEKPEEGKPEEPEKGKPEEENIVSILKSVKPDNIIEKLNELDKLDKLPDIDVIELDDLPKIIYNIIKNHSLDEKKLRNVLESEISEKEINDLIESIKQNYLKQGE